MKNPPKADQHEVGGAPARRSRRTPEPREMLCVHVAAREPQVDGENGEPDRAKRTGQLDATSESRSQSSEPMPTENSASGSDDVLVAAERVARSRRLGQKNCPVEPEIRRCEHRLPDDMVPCAIGDSSRFRERVPVERSGIHGRERRDRATRQ